MIKLKKSFVVALMVLGFTGVVSQILLIRELITTFLGNELSFGIIFFNWLLMVAFGSFGLRKFIDKLNPEQWVITQILISLILPMQIFLARVIKSLVGIEHGEIVGIFPIFYCSLAVLAPICILLGFQFVLGCRIYSFGKGAATQIGKVYVYEALGSMIGGIMFTYFLVHHFHSFEIAAFIGLLNLTSAFFLQHPWIRDVNLKHNLTIVVASLLVLNIYAFTTFVDELHDLSARWQWKNHNLIHYQNSIYTNVVVTQLGEQFNFFANGLLMFTAPEPDIMFIEELIHFPMLQHHSPRNVLLIGGGIGGTLDEILKHPVEKVYYTELDPLIIEVARKYLPSEISNPKVRVEYIDGRLFVKTTQEKFDVVIVNLPPPSTLQLNRLYTLEFFEEVKKILKEDGILSIRLPWSEAYMSKEMIYHNRCIYRTIKEAFPSSLLIPGEYGFILASPNKLWDDAETIAQALEDRGINTRLLTKEYINYKFSEEKLMKALKVLENDVKINSDMRPIAIYYNVVLWNVMFYPHLRTFFDATLDLNLLWFIIPLILLFIFIRIKNQKTIVSFAILTTGFAGITFDILIIFAFQTFYGYVYQQIGIIIAAFMVGLSLGGFYMNRIMKKKNIATLAKIELIICLYSLLLPLILLFPFHYVVDLPMELILPMLNCLAGFLVGLEFPLANKINLNNKKVARVAGTLYASDLLGACLGAILAGVFFIPILGIQTTCIALVLLNLTSFILLIKTAGS